MFVRNGRVRLYYEIRGGEGNPPLLLIRGLARTSEHWRELSDHLGSDFRTIAFDNRGVGRSSTPLPPYTTRQMADDAIRVLDAAGVQRAHVFGISLGGMIAQEVALRHASRVDRLILGCTRAGRRAGTPMSWAAMAAFAGAGRLSPDAAMAHVAPYILSETVRRDRPEVLQEWQRMALLDPPRRIGVFGQMLAVLAHDAVSRLERIRHPTLILTGDADRLIDPSCSRFLERSIPGARFETIAGAGHEFAAEAPRETAEALRRFCLQNVARKAEGSAAPASGS